MENMENPIQRRVWSEGKVEKKIVPYAQDHIGINLGHQLHEYLEGKRSADSVRQWTNDQLNWILDRIKEARDQGFVDEFGKERESKEEKKAA